MSNQRVALVFWGKRGGGEILTIQLQSAGRSYGLHISAYLRPTKNGVPLNSLSMQSWLKARKEVLLEMKRLKIESVIFVMASPWDIFLHLGLRKANIRVIRIIHDARPHPGEFFPPAFWTRLLVYLADDIVVLSKHVASMLEDQNAGISQRMRIGKLPPPPISKNETHSIPPATTVLLFTGRGKKYKGQELLQKAWPTIGDKQTKLLIAGEGHSDRIKDLRTEYRIGWLSNIELENLMRQSSIVLLPYIEASQSGLIPLAQSLGKPVVITPVGGLTEQIINNVSGIVSMDLSPESFASAVNTALTMKWNIPKLDEVEASIELLKVCLARN